MKKRIKVRNIIIILLLLFGSFMITLGILWVHYTGSVGNSEELIKVQIPENTPGDKVGQILEEKGLIKDSLFFKIYIRIKKCDFEHGTYELSNNMSLSEIIEVLEKGNSYNADEISITFKEGINMREIAKVIDSNTENSYDDVMNLIKDKEYLQSLINKYWFIDDSILNNKLYYSLEGYLFPETYRFSSSKVSVQDIFAKLLNQMELVLNEYKDEIENSKYSVHEILTLASIVEKEGKVNDFVNISTVFNNRLNMKKKLESCATTFYGVKREFNEKGIASGEMIANNNPYNTYKIAALPVGPISIPSKKAIDATLNPTDKKYLYFLSDSEGKSYFFNTYAEHQQKQRELQSQGKWYR